MGTIIKTGILNKGSIAKIINFINNDIVPRNKPLTKFNKWPLIFNKGKNADDKNRSYKKNEVVNNKEKNNINHVSINVNIIKL